MSEWNRKKCKYFTRWNLNFLIRFSLMIFFLAWILNCCRANVMHWTATFFCLQTEKILFTVFLLIKIVFFFLSPWVKVWAHLIDGYKRKMNWLSFYKFKICMQEIFLINWSVVTALSDQLKCKHSLFFIYALNDVRISRVFLWIILFSHLQFQSLK